MPSTILIHSAVWPLGMEVGLIPRDFVLDGDPAPLPKRRRSPQFSAHVYCGQTAGWIKMTLGMDVCLGPVHIVLDGDTAPLPKKGQSSPIFGPSLLWPNGCMDQDATWYGGRPRPTQHCVLGLRNVVFDVDPATPREKGTPTLPNFGPCLLWPNGWMDEDAAWYGSRPRPRPHCTRRGPI